MEYTNEQWEAHGIRGPEAAWWGSYGMPPAVAAAWREAGFWPRVMDAAHAYNEPRYAAPWFAHGFSPLVAGEWRQYGFDAATAAWWDAAGFCPQQATRTHDTGKAIQSALNLRNTTTTRRGI